MKKSPSLVAENITFFYSSAILKNQILFFIQQSRSLYRKVDITQPRDIEVRPVLFSKNKLSDW